jgi:hypothetical protein
MKDTQKSAEAGSASDQKFDGFTDEERGAMKERARELKAAARRGKEADEESAAREDRRDVGLGPLDG